MEYYKSQTMREIFCFILFFSFCFLAALSPCGGSHILPPFQRGPQIYGASNNIFPGLLFNIQLIQCIGSLCPSRCIDKKQCFKGGILFNEICFWCGEDEKFFPGKCLPLCSYKQFQEGNCVCSGIEGIGKECMIKCQKNQFWNGKKCTCFHGFARIGGFCSTCPPNSSPSISRDRCVCSKSYLWDSTTNTCSIVCPPFSAFVEKLGKCVCNNGYKKIGDKCELFCGVNEINQKGKCECKSKYIRINGVCTECPINSSPSSKGDSCICDKGYFQDPKTKKCWIMPSSFCKQNEEEELFQGKIICKCKSGYYRLGEKCLKPQCGQNEYLHEGKCKCLPSYIKRNEICSVCPKYSSPSPDQSACICDKNYIWNPTTQTCQFDPPKSRRLLSESSQIVCPPRSVWKARILKCVCTEENEYLIGQECKECGQNEGWNGQQCVCRTGFHKIEGKCQTCDINSFYNGRNCICNHGFYKSKNKCEKCHFSCGKCDGPKDTDCRSCSDVNYDFIDGKCIKNIPCPTGLYLHEKQCQPCSYYCSDCQSEKVCSQCISGFELQEAVVYSNKISFCTQICGDGKRFQLDCDDGNKKDNDGCNSNCEVQDNYTCQGGSSVRASHCVPFTPSRSFIILKGTAHLFGKIVQGIRMSYIPLQLTKNECAVCGRLLWIRVIDSELIPTIRMKYLPKSKYQFVAQFQFHGIFAIPIFRFSIQINPDFAHFFKEADMAQIHVKKVDPALLAKKEKIDVLDLKVESEKIPDEVVEELFKK